MSDRLADIAGQVAGLTAKEREALAAMLAACEDGGPDGEENGGPDGSRALLAPMRPLRTAAADGDGEGTEEDEGTEDGDGEDQGEGEEDQNEDRRGRGCEPGTNRGGGPKTDAGRDRALANLQPDRASITHGVYAYLARGTVPPCGRCECYSSCPFSDGYNGPSGRQHLNPEQVCVVMQAVYQEQMHVMAGEEHLAGRGAYRLLMESRARMAAVAAKIQLVLAQVGLFRQTEQGLQPQALLDLDLRIVGKLLDLSDKLGLTPRSASQLELRFGDDPVASVSVAIEEAHRKRTEQTIDGEFDVE